MQHNHMTLGFKISAWCRCLRALNAGFVFLLLGGPMVHAGDYVYVSNTGTGTITQIDPNGTASLFASGLNSPEGLALNGAGNLFVANSGDRTISAINSLGTVSTFASGLNGPAALAFDPGGNLYVANPGDQTILKIDSSGNASVFATGMAFDGDGAYLAADNAGNIYANTTRTIERFDSNGNRSTVTGGPNFFEGMAVDGAGNLYLALQNAGSVGRFGGTGSLQTHLPDYPAPYNNDLFSAAIQDAPCDLAFDADGNLYATFSNMVYAGSDGSTVYVSDVLMEFGVNGNNRVVATDIGGTYIAVQSVPVQFVPEPGVWAFVGGLAAVLCLGRRLEFFKIGRGGGTEASNPRTSRSKPKDRARPVPALE
jgi:sugar lactone lactonase YvrE